MDASPEVLADTVRAKRSAVDSDLELLRMRLEKADPRRIDGAQWAHWARTAMPALAGVGTLWWWAKRRRSVNSLDRLLVHTLADLLALEQHLLPALARMSAKASNPDLKQAFRQHLDETEAHVERLGRVFRSIGARPHRGASHAVGAVVRDADRLLKRKLDRDVQDAWLIATAQRVEHIEIANYGTARTFAETLGYAHASQLLQQTLEEEQAADEKLTLLAKRFVNPQSVRSAKPPRSDAR